MADVPQAQVGDTVVYYRQDWVNRVDEYSAIVTAINEDGSLDLNVGGFPAGAVSTSNFNATNVRYDPDGKPSSWRLKQTPS